MSIVLRNTCGFLAVATGLTVSYAGAQDLGGPQSLTLGSGDFKVGIIVRPTHLIPTFGPRFDNTAMVSQVTLRGKTYLARHGLTDEFGIEPSGVLGFKEALPGANFLKIGVGELVRPDLKDYGFWNHYKINKLLPVEVRREGDTLSISQKASLNRKYGYEYQKRYRVFFGTRILSIEYSLKNTGSGAFHITHYNHNWFAFSEKAIAPPYFVTTEFPVSSKSRPDWLSIDKAKPLTHLRISRPIKQGVIFESLLGTKATNNRFKIGCGGDNQQVEVRGNFHLHKFALYSEETAICPEAFVDISLKPGQGFTWTREYQFSNF